MISDHTVSDRNNDGWDSPVIWNDFITNNSVLGNAFGFSVDLDNFSETTTNIPNLPNDSILHGPMGNVTEVMWSNGTSFTLNPSQNASVKGVIYRTGSTFGKDSVMCAYARYGNGKVAIIGDSSPTDDGTGDTNDQLYNGYFTDAAGNHQRWLMNITIWLATVNSINGISNLLNENSEIKIYPNPSDGKINLTMGQFDNLNVEVYNIYGEKIYSSVNSQIGTASNCQINLSSQPSGIYFLQIKSEKEILSKKIIIR